MPQLINLGVPYGIVSWPDEATPDDIAADYAALEADRERKIRRAKLENIRLADIVEQQKPSLEKTLLATGLNIREGAVGATKQAVGNIARTAADIFAPQRPIAKWDPNTGQYVQGIEEPPPDSAGALLREAGKDIEQQGSGVLRRAQEETEQLGGGLPAKIGAGLGATAGASAPALLAGPLGIVPASIAAGAQSFGGNISQFKDRLMELDPNLTEEEAFQKAKAPAAITGVTTALLTRTFGGVEKLIEKVTTQGLKAEGVKGLLREVFKSASLEFPEEGIDQLAQGLVEKAYVDPEKKLGDIVNDAAMAGLSGFALGGITAGGIAGPVAVGEKLHEGYTRRSVGKALERGQAAKEAELDRRIAQAAREGQSVDLSSPEADAVERARLRAMGVNVLEPGDPGYAKTTGIGAQTPSQQAQGVEQEAQERLRLRGATQDRVEAQAGTVTQTPVPEAFNTVDDILEFRKKRIDEDINLYQREIGLTREEAEKLTRIMRREASTAKFEKQIGPDRAARLEHFFDESEYNKRGGPWQMWEYDLRLDPEQIQSEDDPKLLAAALVSAVGMHRGQLEASPTNDRYIAAFVAAKRLQETGASMNDVARYVNDFARRESSSQGDAKEFVQDIAARVGAFLRKQNISLGANTGAVAPSAGPETTDLLSPAINPKRPQLEKAFGDLHNKQRWQGPESMIDSRSNPDVQFGTGGWIDSLEHAGDLIHRSSYSGTNKDFGGGGVEYGRGAALSKAKMLLRRYQEKPGWMKIGDDVQEQLEHNYDAYTKRGEPFVTKEEFLARVKAAGERYAIAYENLKPVTEIQQLGRDIAIDTGRFNFQQAVPKLERLIKLLESDDWEKSWWKPLGQPEQYQDLLRPATQRIPIQIKRADGTVVQGEFTGYYDLTSLGRGPMASVGYLNQEGKMTHGMLNAGDEIIGNIPTFEQFQAQQQVDDWANKTTAPGLQRARTEEATTFVPRQEGQAPAVQAAQVTPEFRPVDWQAFVTQGLQGNTVDWARMRAEVEAGNFNGGEAANALLLHLLKRSDLHPVEISVLDVSPNATSAITREGEISFHGRLRLRKDGGPSLIEIVTKGFDEKTITQAEFMKTLNHELTHNNVTTKWRNADALTQQDLQDLFEHITQQATGTEFQGHNALRDIDEFLAEAFSSPKIQRWLASMDYSGKIRMQGGKPVITPSPIRNSAFGKFLDIVKRILRLPDFVTDLFGNRVDTITALDQAISLGAKLENLGRQPASTRGTTPAADAPLVSYSRAVPSPQQAQVSGGAAEVGRIAEQIYKDVEVGPQVLETMEYERKQYRAARDEMQRIAGLATGRFVTDGITADMIGGGYPDPLEDVGIEDGQIVVGDVFANKVAFAGVEVPPYVQEMQGEIYFETQAARLVSMRRRLETLLEAQQYYEELGVSDQEKARIRDMVENQDVAIQKLEAVTWDGRTVGARASQIDESRTIRRQALAKRDALALDPVNDFFGKVVGGYRKFTEKVAKVYELTQALRNQATDPAQIEELSRQADIWNTMPEDVRRSVRNGAPLTPEQRATVFAMLAQVYEDFDIQRSRMQELIDSRTPEINSTVQNLLEQSSKAKVERSMVDILLADMEEALKGKPYGTGTLQSQQVAEDLQKQLSAILSFAESLGRHLETNRDLYNWLANPVSQKTFMVANARELNINEKTLDQIMHLAKSSPEFSSAVVNLIDHANAKLAALPITQLQQIEALLKAGDQTGAEALADEIRRRSRARASNNTAALREALSQIDALLIERASLDEGMKMFDRLASTEEFNNLRNDVSNSPFGYVEKMVQQNNTATTFKPFGGKGIPTHAGLVMGAADNPVLKSEWHVNVAKWYKAAQQHLDAYDAANLLYQADQKNNKVNQVKSPTELGYDLPKIRGLRDAVDRFVRPSFLEISLLSEDKNWRVPWLVRKLGKTSWFRQHNFAAKMVGGVSGVDLRARLADFDNHFLIARHIVQRYNDIPDLIYEAMDSHPTMQMNMANYREFWNELAHYGREFGTQLRVGFDLPRSGLKVTSQDLALLKRQVKFEEDLRREVTETNAVSGIRVKAGKRELIRKGAFVGDLGMPRHINRYATTFMADVLAAYGENKAGFDPSTQLGPASDNAIVQYWNRNTKLLIQHILDAPRQDRSMRLSPQMQQAEQDAASSWIANGVPSVDSIDQLVARLAPFYPDIPGVNKRNEIIKGLNAELRQYRDAAARIQQERAETDDARHSKVTIPFSAQNEFTQPAAKLELPTVYYDYGAITPAEFLTVTSRANHERIVNYATAVVRATNELQNRVDRVRKKELTEEQAAKSYGGNFNEMKDVLEILQLISEDFKAAYALGSPNLTQSEWYRDGFGALTSAVLALPTVGIRNMTQGMFEVYMMSRAMGLGGERWVMTEALKAMAKTVTHFALSAGHAIASKTDMFAAGVTGTNVDIFKKMVTAMADAVFQPNFIANSQRVNELGYDTRDRFLSRLKRIWQSTAETNAPEELVGRTVTIGGKKRKLTKLGLAPLKALRAAFDKVGVQQYDSAINSALLTYTEFLERRLEEVAMRYGQNREALGLVDFDPMDPRWTLKPDEWAAFGSTKKNEDSLALFQTFLQTSAAPEGFQLEEALWRSYQGFKAGARNRMFTDRQFDAVQRRMLAEFNASTPTNRSSASAGNNVIRNLLTLQGYTSDGLMKLINSFGAIRDRKTMAQTLSKMPITATLAFMSLVIGMISASLTGIWEEKVRGRLPTLPNPLDADFWTSWERFKSGIIRLGFAQLFYVGDAVLAARGEVQGNRGFDPLGRVFPVSIAQRMWHTAQGMWNTYKVAGDVSDSLKPLADFGRSLTPYWMEAENLFGEAQGYTKQTERLTRGEGQLQGLLPENRGAFSGSPYGPTTIIRRNLSEAVSALEKAREKNDPAAAQSAIDDAKTEIKKLEDYYTEKYVSRGDDPETAREKAGRDVWNDYQELNPIVAGLGGKRPTEAQFEILKSGFTGVRGEMFNKGIKAWQNGAMELFGREGNITREDVGLARGGGGGPRRLAAPTTYGELISQETRQAAGGFRRRPRGLRVARLPASGYLRPARPARAVKPGSIAPRPRLRRPNLGPAPRPAGAPTVTRQRSRLGRLRRLNRRISRRMNRRQTYVFE